MGADRFKRRLQQAEQSGQASTVGGARKLLSHAIDPTSALIQSKLDNKERGKRHTALKWVRLLGPDVAAYMAVKNILDHVLGCGGDPNRSAQSLRMISQHISETILDELKYRRFKEQAPGLFDYKLQNFRTSSYAHMSRSLNASMSFAGIDISDLQMSPTQRFTVGSWLVGMVVEATGMVEVIAEQKPRASGKAKFKSELRVLPTEATVKWLAKRNGALELFHPYNLPMVVPPLAWGKERRGGYRFAQREKYSLMRGVPQHKAQAVEKNEMPMVYGTLNRLQDTAWRINPDVFELAEAVLRKGGGWGKVPVLEPEQLPSRPHDIAENPEARKRWRREAGKIRNTNHTRAMAGLGYHRVMSVARRMSPESAFFFPYNLDFRGRIYPISDFLSPQGDDLQKGLLTFAQGTPMGEDGGKWLSVHLANCVGEWAGQKMSKLTINERIRWVWEQREHILATAEDPFGSRGRWWTEVDEPFQFYAASCEFKRWADTGYSDEYVCALPVGMDGSCNGLQHFAALLKDEEGAKAVNVVPQQRPQDVYDEVAHAVLGQLETLAVDNEMARLWLSSGQVNRKLCKRPTMTFGYGSKRFGFRSQIIEHLMGLDEWPMIAKHFSKEGDNGKRKVLVPEAAALMADLIWYALEARVSGAFHGMAWLQACARVIAKNGKAVHWTVPITGLPVSQGYYVENMRRVDTVIAGKLMKPAVYEDTDQVAAHKQANGIAPNVVHSLDAAALMLTVMQAADDGVEAFGMVHDSYATTPGVSGVLAKATRESFVRLYTSVNVLGHFYETFTHQAADPKDIPCPPPVGNLDLGGVLASDYFFC